MTAILRFEENVRGCFDLMMERLKNHMDAGDLGGHGGLDECSCL